MPTVMEKNINFLLWQAELDRKLLKNIKEQTELKEEQKRLWEELKKEGNK